MAVIQPRLRIEVADPGYGVARFGPVSIAVWRGDVRAAWIRRSTEAMRAAISEHPNEAIAIHLIEEVAPIPGNEARDAFADAIRNTHGLCCAVIIGEGDSFATSVVRTIVAGLTLIVRPGAPLKVYPTLTEAAKWAMTRRPATPKTPISAADILNAAEEARRALPKA